MLRGIDGDLSSRAQRQLRRRHRHRNELHIRLFLVAVLLHGCGIRQFQFQRSAYISSTYTTVAAIERWLGCRGCAIQRKLAIDARERAARDSKRRACARKRSRFWRSTLRWSREETAGAKKLSLDSLLLAAPFRDLHKRTGPASAKQSAPVVKTQPIERSAALGGREMFPARAPIERSVEAAVQVQAKVSASARNEHARHFGKSLLGLQNVLHGGARIDKVKAIGGESHRAYIPANTSHHRQTFYSQNLCESVPISAINPECFSRGCFERAERSVESQHFNQYAKAERIADHIGIDGSYLVAQREIALRREDVSAADAENPFSLDPSSELFSFDGVRYKSLQTLMGRTVRGIGQPPRTKADSMRGVGSHDAGS